MTNDTPLVTTVGAVRAALVEALMAGDLSSLHGPADAEERAHYVEQSLARLAQQQPLAYEPPTLADLARVEKGGGGETVHRADFDAARARFVAQQPQPGADAVREAAAEQARRAFRGALYTAWMMGRTYPADMDPASAVDTAWAWIRDVAPEIEGRLLATLAAPPRPDGETP